MKILNDKAIVIGLEKINLNDFPKLEVLGVNTTGLDHLPWKEIHKRNIKVISLKGETEFLKDITSTAEHTIGLMIALSRGYHKALNTNERTIGHTLSGKTLGIVGYGRIGKQVKKIAKALGMKVITCEKNFKKLEKLLKKSDIVSIHIPLEENEGFFTRIMFQKMKPSAYLINTSRDKVIEEGALIWALENDIIAGAGIDFIDDEKLVNYSKLHDDLILTNHIGGATIEDRKKTKDFIIKKVLNYLTN